MLKLGNIFQGISNKTSYARTEVGGWIKSKAYSRVQSRWVGQKRDGHGRTYFLDDPMANWRES